MKTFTQIREMTLALGHMNTPLDVKSHREKQYEENKHRPELFKVGKVSIHHESTPNSTTLYTMNHHNKECVHRAIFKVHPTHIIQTVVERHQHAELPKHHSSNIALSFSQMMNKPLRTSHVQSTNGHKMWKHMVNWALDNGNKVEYHDGSKVHQTTKDNMKQHLSDYYGDHKDRYIQIHPK